MGIAPRAIFELGSIEIGSSKSHPDLRAESLAIYVRRCKKRGIVPIFVLVFMAALFTHTLPAFAESFDTHATKLDPACVAQVITERIDPDLATVKAGSVITLKVDLDLPTTDQDVGRPDWLLFVNGKMTNDHSTENRMGNYCYIVRAGLDLLLPRINHGERFVVSSAKSFGEGHVLITFEKNASMAKLSCFQSFDPGGNTTDLKLSQLKAQMGDIFDLSNLKF